MTDRTINVIAYWAIIITVVGLAFGWKWALIPVGMMALATAVGNIR